MGTPDGYLEETLLDLLVCPVDREPLSYIATENVLYNPRLRKSYDIVDSIPVMLVEESHDVDDTTHERYLGHVTRLTGAPQ